MFDIYLDDTADESQKFVGFGGFAGKREAWEAAEKDFQSANARHCISRFHAKNYPQYVTEYASLVLKRELFFLGASLDYEAYREFATRPRRDNFGGNEWVSCAGYLFRLAGENIPDGEEATVVLDCRTPYSTSVYEQWERRESDKLVALTVIDRGADRVKDPFLQIADLAANLLCRHVRCVHYGSPEPDLLEPFLEHKSLGLDHLDKGKIYALAAYLTKPDSV